MITSFSEYRNYLALDLKANFLTSWHFYDRFRYPQVHFQRHLRRAELILNLFPGKLWAPLRLIVLWRLRAHGIRLGFTIPPNVFGPGLSIAHWGTIVINKNCRIGSFCRLYSNTCIGSIYGGPPPRLGDHCYVGNGATIIGDIQLGDYTVIGANSLVNRSFPEGKMTIVGNPAKVVKRATDVDAPGQSWLRGQDNDAG